MFEEEAISHKVLKKTPTSETIYPNISRNTGIITPKSTDDADDGDEHFHVNMSTELTGNMSSSNENIKNSRDLEVEEIVRRSREEEEEEEEEDPLEIPSSQQMPPFSHSMHPNIKETKVSKMTRLPHLQPSPEPVVLNIDVKKKSKKLTNKN